MGKKGKNTVQALVIFGNFMDGERSNMNQTNNDVIKNARGVRQAGEAMRSVQSRRRDLRCMQKSGEFVTPNGRTGDASG